jgi:hypothetical protein
MKHVRIISVSSSPPTRSPSIRCSSANPVNAFLDCSSLNKADQLGENHDQEYPPWRTALPRVGTQSLLQCHLGVTNVRFKTVQHSLLQLEFTCSFRHSTQRISNLGLQVFAAQASFEKPPVPIRYVRWWASLSQMFTTRQGSSLRHYGVQGRARVLAVPSHFVCQAAALAST